MEISVFSISHGSASAGRMSGLSQGEIDLAAEELETEGMLKIERTYTLLEN